MQWQQAEADIVRALDVAAEYRALGVRFAKDAPSASGWQACYAVDRDEQNPSAAVNVRTGRYRDLGGDGLSLSLWEAAARFGAHADWREARKAVAKKAGVKLPHGKPPVDPAEHLEFLPWNDRLAALWCGLHKPGTTPEAVQAAGGRRATYRKQYHVLAFPVLGPAGGDADPVGWLLFRTDGQKLPIFHGKGQKPSWKPEKLTYGSEPGLLGLHALERRDREDVKLVWKVEGLSDLLALWAAIPQNLRDTHLVVTNANGANEDPKPSMSGVFEGRRVAVVHDADTAGEAGAEKWCKWLAGFTREVRHVRLPYEVTDNHGKDLRDWLNE